MGLCQNAPSQSVEPPLDPVFSQNTEIVVSPLPAPIGAVQDGTERRPYYVGGPKNFDRFMRSFRDVNNVTFRLKEGVFETSGDYEVVSGQTPSPHLWQPANGWRILGAGMGKTILRLVDIPELTPTKYQVIGNSASYRFIEHLEIAHLTLDADGARHAERSDSGFGCASFTGSWLHLHHLECLNGFNALSPSARNAATHREIFLLGVGGKDGYQSTNNWIRKCYVRPHPESPKAFPGQLDGLVTLLANSSNVRSTDDSPDYTWRPRILDCVVEGISAQKRINGVSMFGCVDGVCQGNQILNARFGFYTDESSWTPSFFLLNNVISNSLIGVFFNYQIPGHRWGDAVIQSNVVYSCKDCAPNPNGFTIAMSFNGNPKGMTSSFERILISSNLVVGPVPTTNGTSSALDYGIQVVNARSSLVYNNSVRVQRGYRSLLVWPNAQYPSDLRFCQNVDAVGLPLKAIDRSLPGCRDSYLANPPACQFPDLCVEGNPFAPPFDFADLVPPPYPGQPAPVAARHIVMLAREGEIIAPSFTNSVAGAWDGVSVVSTNQDKGGVSFSVHVPVGRAYQLWAKIKPPDPRVTGFFDLELDGERRLFGALTVNAGTNWAWHALTERLQDSGRNSIRRQILFAGWHTLTFWTRNPGVQLDMVCLTSATEDSFIPNDPVVQTLLITRPLNMTRAHLARECPWNTTLEAEVGEVVPPMEIVGDAEAIGGLATGSVVPHRGEITHRFAVPSTQLYEISVRIKPDLDTPENRTVVMLLDGREWILAAEADPRWQWISRAGATEDEATSPTGGTGAFRLMSGWHRLTLRTRSPGVSLDSIQITAIPKTAY